MRSERGRKMSSYMSKEEALEEIRIEALETISEVMRDWDGPSSEEKYHVIDGIMTFLAGLEERFGGKSDDDT